jgi:glycosyltransferase involved in cell wall biosynthesis
MLPVVLTFVRFYLPGFKSGGPVRSIANMVEALGDEYEFRIVTSDRDMLDPEPYANIQPDRWTRIGKSWVYYASKGNRGALHWRRLMREQPHDVLYLNSLFDPTFTLAPLFARRFLPFGSKPVIVAPRGELSPGALASKWWKKSPFLAVARSFDLYGHVLWHASSEEEAALIRRSFGDVGAMAVARNLPSQNSYQTSIAHLSEPDGVLRIVFLSRISRQKNLEYALRIMSRCMTPVRFDIWGTIEDTGYWRACERLIQDMPGNVQVSYRGVAHHKDVLTILARYDLFFLPTRGESYGHVIAESLSAGTPVLVSDQTPWRRLAEHGIGWDLPLDKEGTAFLQAIETASRKDPVERAKWRQAASEYALACARDPDLLAANRNVFATAMRMENSR